MESPEVLQGARDRGAAVTRTVEGVSDADTPRSALPQAVAATTPHHTIATPHHTSSGAGAMEDDSDDDAPRARPGRAPPRPTAAEQQRRRQQPIKTSKEAAAPLTAPLAAPLTARVPDAADGYAATTLRVRTPAAQRAYEEKHADSDDDQPPTKPEKDSSDDDDGPVYDDMEDLHQGMKEMIGTDDFDMGRNLGMSTYFYTTFLKALLVACLVAGLFSLKIMRRYRRGHFGTRTSKMRPGSGRRPGAPTT